ncbi:cobalt ECF transporter T component CbiQ [Paraclostridium bifermentans]|jgi:cobalt/nickel transport system permease protein|uniref:cobalt ECF transporter T component CbiQ n=1 Tax=Paraclostridium bifermentans TaxID=1490 RepID=UPI00189C42DC|nr:cobalt ECF transporter T component CbiQ [Paraclostridium bifermentans]MBS5954714.1 cobalt ECF transporter T component CbiQ [Paraclostridium bifermentans]MBS6508156.1 cobalt ECF transporter T component CbiQ [Paraclostridium bifermentans]MBU5289034.1 cobalt ECF transporter T component CbiQ [Paraclostridium bifermentans]MDU3802820.1 cobalt ECF transporter T component CbiQ [Paraclostridium bifermentans]
MLEIDNCAYLNNIKDVNPLIKLGITFIGVIASMLTQNANIHILIMLFMTALILFIARVDMKLYIKCLKIPIIFLIIGIGLNLINISFENKDYIFNVNILGLYIGTTEFAVKSSVNILLRAMSCIISIYFLILTTPFNQLIIVLKKLYIPHTLIELMILIYRFIFIFIEEAEEIYKSQQLKFGYTNLRTSYNSMSLLIKTLFFRMMRRYEDMSISLDIKLYDGKFHV